MKFSCTQENLHKGLSIVNHIANKNTTLPILNNVLLKVAQGNLLLSTTNLEIGISCVIHGKAEQEGSFTVQAKLLHDYVSLLQKDNVNLNLEGSSLQVTCLKSKTKINGLSAEDFPVIPRLEKTDFAQIKTKDFKKAINQVIFAVANDESRPEISGVFMIFKENTLTLVTTDSYRLAEKKVSLIKNFSQDKEVIVPAKTLQEVGRIIADTGAENLDLVLSDNQIMFILGDVEIVSRLIEGQYPDYKQIILDTFKTTTVVNVGQLVNVVKSASLFCKVGINDINLRFLSDKSEIIITASNSQLGENENIINTELIGESNEIVLNYKYFLDGLNSLDSNEVEIKLIDESTQAMVKAKDKDDYRYIIMPVILN